MPTNEDLIRRKEDLIRLYLDIEKRILDAQSDTGLDALHYVDYAKLMESAPKSILMGLLLESVSKMSEADEQYRNAYTNIARMGAYAFRYFARKKSFELIHNIKRANSWWRFHWHLGSAEYLLNEANKKCDLGEDSLLRGEHLESIDYFKQSISDSLDGLRGINEPPLWKTVLSWLTVIGGIVAATYAIIKIVNALH